LPEPLQVQITLRADAVIAPALRAIIETIEVINFCLTAIDKDNLSKPPEYASSRFHMSFDRSYLSAEARKTAYTSWLLCKGFQELARSIRQMLEEAFFYNSMIEFAERESSRTKSWG
jgi:hypothetical protein